MATFPSDVKSFTTRSNGDTITPAFFNDSNDEITAVESFLRNSMYQQVNSSGLLVGTAYAPVWSTTGTAPTVGNATLAGMYWRIGKLVLYTLSFTFGSTSVAGTGTFKFTIPVTASGSGAAGAGSITDTSAGFTYGINGVLASSTTLAVYPSSSGNTGVTVSVPFTWATGDTLSAFGFVQTI